MQARCPSRRRRSWRRRYDALVNSALQRARATLREHLGEADRKATPAANVSAAEAALLDRYIQAHESGDVELTLALIADDVRVTMPPAPYLFEGRDAIFGLVERSGSAGEWRLLPTRANRQPAAACYFGGPGEATFQAFKIDVLRMGDGVIREITTFGAKHFPAFDLPQLLS